MKLLRVSLTAAKQPNTDSPIFQYVDGMSEQSTDREKTDVFREQVHYSATVKEELAEARNKDERC